MIRTQLLVASLAGTLMAAENPRLDYATGVLEELRGVGTAQDHFEKARLADPRARPLVQRAIKQRLESNERPAAVKLFRDLAAARPDDLGVQLGYADFLEDQAKGDSLAKKLVVETLESALGKSPGHPQIIRRLFHHAQAAGDKTRQGELLEMLAAEDPESVLLYASLSKSLYDKADREARAKLDGLFVRAIESEAANPTLARTASDHFHDTDRPAEAIRILENHAKAAPSSLALRTRLGILYFEAKRDAEGEAALKEVLSISPRIGLAHQALAKFYRLREQPGRARGHAGELLKIRGGSPADFLRLADEWLAANEPRQARLLLEYSVFDHPENRDLAVKLAIATRRDPETRNRAARLFREAETAAAGDGKAKPDPVFLLESAEALISEGQSKAAEDRLRAAIRAFPGDSKKETAGALRRLALLWESENRNTEAARSLRQRAEALDR